MDNIRVGKVSSVNYYNGTVKVIFEDKKNIVSNNLPCLSFEYNMPQVGDMVLCVFLGNGIKNGFCIGTYFDNSKTPQNPGKNLYYKEILGETVVMYDKNTKTLTITADNIVFDGNLVVNGNVNIMGNLTANNI